MTSCRLMAHSGVTDLFDYAEFLALDESTMLKVNDMAICTYLSNNISEIQTEMQRNIEIEIDIPKKQKRNTRRMSIGTLRNNLGACRI